MVLTLALGQAMVSPTNTAELLSQYINKVPIMCLALRIQQGKDTVSDHRSCQHGGGNRLMKDLHRN